MTFTHFVTLSSLWVREESLLAQSRYTTVWRKSKWHEARQGQIIWLLVKKAELLVWRTNPNVGSMGPICCPPTTCLLGLCTELPNQRNWCACGHCGHLFHWSKSKRAHAQQPLCKLWLCFRFLTAGAAPEGLFALPLWKRLNRWKGTRNGGQGRADWRDIKQTLILSVLVL